MADGIAITAGSGTTVNTDDIAGVHTQRVKVTWGTDGTVTDASAAAPLPTVQTGALPAGANNIGDVDVLGGGIAHDSPGTGAVPLLVGGYASAAAPTDVSADGDAVRAWLLRNGAQAIAITAAGTLVGAGTGTAATALRTVSSSDDPMLSILAAIAPTCTTSITRPADTNIYAVGDAISNSTSAPTSGGFTFTSAARANGKTVTLTDIIVVSSNPAANPLSGRLIIFDTAVTAVNDNAALAITDAEALTVVADIPFALVVGVNNSWVNVQNINVNITAAAGSSDLRFLVMATNAYTPASAEVITFRAKFQAVN